MSEQGRDEILWNRNSHWTCILPFRQLLKSQNQLLVAYHEAYVIADIPNVNVFCIGLPPFLTGNNAFYVVPLKSTFLLHRFLVLHIHYLSSCFCLIWLEQNSYIQILYKFVTYVSSKFHYFCKCLIYKQYFTRNYVGIVF